MQLYKIGFGFKNQLINLCISHNPDYHSNHIKLTEIMYNKVNYISRAKGYKSCKPTVAVQCVQY